MLVASAGCESATSRRGQTPSCTTSGSLMNKSRMETAKMKKTTPIALMNRMAMRCAR